jgi:hypothetical protein
MVMSEKWAEPNFCQRGKVLRSLKLALKIISTSNKLWIMQFNNIRDQIIVERMNLTGKT